MTKKWVSLNLDSKEKEKEYRAFEKAVIDYPYCDTEELDDEHYFIFEWFWKRYEKIREDAWKYQDLS